MELKMTWPLLTGYWILLVPYVGNVVHFQERFLVKMMDPVVVNHQQLDGQCYQKNWAICQLILQELNLQHIHPERIYKRVSNKAIKIIKTKRRQWSTCWWVLILSSRDNTICFHVSTSGARPVFKDFSTAWQYLRSNDNNEIDPIENNIADNIPWTYFNESEIFPTSASIYAYISLYGWNECKTNWEFPSSFEYSYNSVLCPSSHQMSLSYFGDTSIQKKISNYTEHVLLESNCCWGGTMQIDHLWSLQPVGWFIKKNI
jgi:hypothetical protein